MKERAGVDLNYPVVDFKKFLHSPLRSFRRDTSEVLRVQQPDDEVEMVDSCSFLSRGRNGTRLWDSDEIKPNARPICRRRGLERKQLTIARIQRNGENKQKNTQDAFGMLEKGMLSMGVGGGNKLDVLLIILWHVMS